MVKMYMVSLSDADRLLLQQTVSRGTAAARTITVPLVLLLAFTAIFASEFTVRCWDAPSRWDYAHEHWLDIISCVPLIGASEPSGSSDSFASVSCGVE